MPRTNYRMWKNSSEVTQRAWVDKIMEEWSQTPRFRSIGSKLNADPSFVQIIVEQECGSKDYPMPSQVSLVSDLMLQINEVQSTSVEDWTPAHASKYSVLTRQMQVAISAVRTAGLGDALSIVLANQDLAPHA